MKQCPVCRTTYTDDSLSFCLNDGAALAASPDSEITQRMFFDLTPTIENSAPTRVRLQPETNAQNAFPQSPPETRNNINILLALGGVFLAVALAGGALIYYAFVKKDSVPAANLSPISSPTVAQNSTPDETQALKDKLNKLEKQLNEQKNAKANSSIPASPVTQPTLRSARVNSPNDGFLALRSAPNSKTGYQILQIPHGAAVSVNGCQDYTISGSIRGHWCRVIYSGQEGWAFDAYLVY